MGTVALREAVWADCRRLFDWSNDEDVRRESFHQRKIPYGEHEAWFAAKLQDSSCQIFILLSDGQEAGMIRLDWRRDGGEISYLIAPRCRGRGLGSEILRLVEAYAPGRTLYGRVKKRNEASLRCFLRNGYTVQERQEYLECRKEIPGGTGGETDSL